MDWNREVDRAIISEVPMDDILQIKREHITEPIKRSIELYGNTTTIMAEKLARLQKDTENSRQCDVSFKERGVILPLFL